MSFQKRFWNLEKTVTEQKHFRRRQRDAKANSAFFLVQLAYVYFKPRSQWDKWVLHELIHSRPWLKRHLFHAGRRPGCAAYIIVSLTTPDCTRRLWSRYPTVDVYNVLFATSADKEKNTKDRDGDRRRERERERNVKHSNHQNEIKSYKRHIIQAPQKQSHCKLQKQTNSL